MKKRLIVLGLASLLILVCVSCTNKVEKKDVELCGGWVSVTETKKEDVIRFNKVMGDSYTDIKVVARQVVSGMNYKYEYVDETGNKMTAIIYEDLEGNLKILEN